MSKSSAAFNVQPFHLSFELTMSNVLQGDFPPCVKSVFVSPLCVIQCADWSWSLWPFRTVLWSCRAPRGEHLDLPFWSCSDLCVTETSSESQPSAGNETAVDSLGRNSELKFFFFNIKKKKEEGNKKGKVWVTLWTGKSVILVCWIKSIWKEIPFSLAQEWPQMTV